MTPNERKVWDNRVFEAEGNRPRSCVDDAILAANAELTRLRGIAENEKGLLDIIKNDEGELKRLREAVEWACDGLRASRFRSDDAFVGFRDELRRRAKEGKG